VNIRNWEQECILRLGDSDSQVRSDAAFALGEIGSGDSIQPLLDLLKDFDKQVRKNAVRALGLIGGCQAIPFLLESLKDSSPFVRGNAVLAIVKISGELHWAEIKQILTAEDHRWVLCLMKRHIGG